MAVDTLAGRRSRSFVKKPALGTGERFAELKGKLSAQSGVKNPGALAASIGRKRYGKARFQSLAAKGKPGY